MSQQQPPQGGYPQQGGYPPPQYPPQGGGYPQQGGYPPPQYPPQQYGGYPPAPPPKAGGNSRSPLVIGGVIGAIALIAVIAFLVLQSGGGGALANAYAADKMPNTFSMYGSIRTDDGYINSLNDIFVRFRDPIVQILRETSGNTMGVESMTLQSLLDQAVQNGEIGLNFNSAIRSWLGNNASIGLGTRLDGRGLDFLVAIAITNKDEASKFVQANFIRYPEDWTQSEESGFTLWTYYYPSDEPQNQQVIALGSDVLYLASSRFALPLTAPSSPLSGDAKFTATLSTLPAGNYNVTAYGNIDTLLTAARLDGQVLRAINALGMNGSFAAGATIIDGRSFTVDMVIKPSTTGETAFKAISTPIDLDFARFMPENTIAMVQGSNLKQAYDVGLNLLRTTSTGGQLVDEYLNQANSAMSLIGLNLQTDILEWLTGDYAIYVSADVNRLVNIIGNPTPSEMVSDFGIEAGILIKATNADKARNLVERLNGLIGLGGSQLGLIVNREQIGGANAIVIDLSNQGVPMKFVIGANNDVLVIGTYNSAKNALEGNGRLNGFGRYQDARAYMLPNSTTLAYLDREVLQISIGLVVLGPAIQNVFNNILEEMGSGSRSTPATPLSQSEIQRFQDMGNRIFSLVNSSTVTTAVSSDGTFTARMTVTLAP